MTSLTPMDFVWIAALEEGAADSIERQNWTDTPVTPREQRLIAMAVSWTYGTLKEMAETQEPVLP